MEQEKQIHTEVVDIDDLIQDDHNFNKGTEAGAELIGRSFKEHGAGRSVFIDKNNRLVGGNKAQKGFKGAGYRKVVIVDSDPDTLVAVRRKDVDLDTKEGREMAMLDNLTTQVNLAWDETEIQNVSDQVEGFDPGDFGWTPPDVADPTADVEVEEDDFDPDAEPVPTTCKAGDVWQLGNHRLMCGDSTKAEDVAKLMNGEQADLWLTDPPYNVDYSAKNAMLNKMDGGSRVEVDIEHDKMSDEQFHDFLHDAFTSAYNVMKAGCPFYVWTTQGHALSDIQQELDKVGLIFRQQIIWRKNNFVLGRMDYQGNHEPCFYGWKEGAHYFIKERNHTTVWSDEEEIDIDKMKKDEMKALLHQILDQKEHTSVIDCPKPQRSGEHPTMKPVRLFGYLMRNSSRQHDIILDTFGGSGTTIVAAEQLDRKARLMELDPHYCDVIIARWEKLTGQKAQKI